jgi:hypothetical protein
MYIVVSFGIDFITFFYIDSGTACLQETIYSFERILLYSMQKSSNFLLEIMTLVSSANIMGIEEVFSVGGRPFIYIRKSRGLGNSMLYCSPV